MKNEMSFVPEEVEKGMHLDLLNYLLNYNEKSEDHFNDIHITSDGYCTTVEWESVPVDRAYGGSFQYVGEDQYVMTECVLPDRTVVMCHDEDEVKETLANFLKEHPEYHKDYYGRWCDGDEISELTF